MGFGMFFDPTIIIILPAIILAGVAQAKVHSAYAKYSKVKSVRGITGAEAAREFLRVSGITDVEVEEVGGKLSDHYDPMKKKVRLSRDIYSGNSIASLSIAAHEVGHAIQHNEGYLPLSIRSVLAPVAGFSSNASWILITIGMLISYFSNNLLLLQIGIVLFTLVVLFQVVTLPVEFNASTRAMEMLRSYNYLQDGEMKGSKKMLSAAALTYVAAAITGILQLVRLLVILNSREE